jgi:hypothetical protein
MRAFPIALAVCLLPSMPMAQPTQGPAHFKYYGSISCGDWHQNTEPEHDIYNALKMNLVLGFLAGRGAAYGVDLLGRVDQSNVRAWLDSYCGSHPLDDLSSAAFALEKELLARERPVK